MKIVVTVALILGVLASAASAQSPARPTVPGYGPKCFKTSNYSDCVRVCSSGACDPRATPSSCANFCGRKFRR
jgi:hypothetical protein